MNIIYKLKYKIISAIKWIGLKIYGISRPIYSSHSNSGLKIHLGAGTINIQGWVNIDARDASHIHLQSKGFDLNEFNDGSISEIYMCHVLEHFSFAETKLILKKLHQKLRRGGVLRLSVPDFDQLIAIYYATDKNLEIIKMALMGGQDYEFNYHKAVFNERLLTDLLISCGFKDVQIWNTKDDFGTDLGDWSNKGFDTPKGNISISLNIKSLK